MGRKLIRCTASMSLPKHRAFWSDIPVGRHNPEVLAERHIEDDWEIQFEKNRNFDYFEDIFTYDTSPPASDCFSTFLKRGNGLKKSSKFLERKYSHGALYFKLSLSGIVAVMSRITARIRMSDRQSYKNKKTKWLGPNIRLELQASGSLCEFTSHDPPKYPQTSVLVKWQWKSMSRTEDVEIDTKNGWILFKDAKDTDSTNVFASL